MELTPEERERIVEEERVRLQVRKQLEEEHGIKTPDTSNDANAERSKLGVKLAYAGISLLIVGLTALVYFSFIFSVAVPVEVPRGLQPFASLTPANVNNVGLMSDRQNGVILGSVLAVLGAGLLIPGLVLSAGRRRGAFGATSTGLVALAVVFLCAARSGVTTKDVSRGISRAVGSSSVDDSEAHERLKQVAVGMLMFSADHDGKFPDLSSSAVARIAIEPYMGNHSPNVFEDPASGKPWAFNAAMSGVSEESVKHGESVIVAYSPDPLSDGARYCAFVDGHYKKLTKEKWDAALTTKTIKAEQGYSSDSTMTPQ